MSGDDGYLEDFVPAEQRDGRDWVALVLAIGMAVSLFAIVFAMLYETVFTGGPLSDNAAQILTGAFGGLIGILGSYLGYHVGGEAARRSGSSSAAPADAPADDADQLGG